MLWKPFEAICVQKHEVYRELQRLLKSTQRRLQNALEAVRRHACTHARTLSEIAGTDANHIRMLRKALEDVQRHEPYQKVQGPVRVIFRRLHSAQEVFECTDHLKHVNHISLGTGPE